MTPEVAARLKEITVDPKTVTITKPAAAPGATLPKPAAALTPGVYTYAATLEVGGQTMNLSMSTEIKDDPAGWSITDTTRTPQGDVVDRGILDKTTLAVRKRTVTQGPVTITIDVAPGGKITGTANMGGQERPVNVDAGGDLVADDPGGVQVVAALPLADGYRTSLRNFDVSTMKVRIVQLVVSGSEQVRVPAGTFDAWKVELTSDDGATMTVWIDKARRTVARISATLPQMNGAKLTAELQK
jgi:hypothetical protein